MKKYKSRPREVCRMTKLMIMLTSRNLYLESEVLSDLLGPMHTTVRLVTDKMNASAIENLISLATLTMNDKKSKIGRIATYLR